jgi:hypothetical protein
MDKRGDALKPGDKVIVRDLSVRGSQLFVGIVRVDGVGPFVYASPMSAIDLRVEYEGIYWCRGDELDSPAARALEVAAVLTS